MGIGSISRKKVITVDRLASVEAAAEAMRNHHVGDVVVVGAENLRVPVGILTDRDIVVNIVAEGVKPGETPVWSVMSNPVVLLREDEGFIEALDKMSARGVRRAPVVDAHGNLCGVISVDDLVLLLARELAKIGAVIRHGQATEVQKIEKSFDEVFLTS